MDINFFKKKKEKQHKRTICTQFLKKYIICYRTMSDKSRGMVGGSQFISKEKKRKEKSVEHLLK